MSHHTYPKNLFLRKLFFISSPMFVTNFWKLNFTISFLTSTLFFLNFSIETVCNFFAKRQKKNVNVKKRNVEFNFHFCTWYIYLPLKFFTYMHTIVTIQTSLLSTSCHESNQKKKTSTRDIPQICCDSSRGMISTLPFLQSTSFFVMF